MMRRVLAVILALLMAGPCTVATAGAIAAGAKEVAEYIIKRFGPAATRQTVDEVAAAVSGVAAKYGDEAVPFLRASGHAGFDALDQAGSKAPEVIKLYIKRGDEAVWIISKPEKLAIFIKHGDTAAEALIKHPGIADTLIAKYGDDAAGALANVSRQSSQRLGMVVEEGLLEASSRSPELLGVIRMYGDEAMDFVWKNKGALAVTSVLASFLNDPQAYISGAKGLIEPVVRSVNWTLILGVILLVIFLPVIARSLMRARRVVRSRRGTTDAGPSTFN